RIKLSIKLRILSQPRLHCLTPSGKSNEPSDYLIFAIKESTMCSLKRGGNFHSLYSLEPSKIKGKAFSLVAVPQITMPGWVK
ncbi:hypothetical protein, partial [Saccharibacillus kuerlensis]|uniref:hypothetical protein n=1 Tax=Saccharibacillus kuerlensis TaxID=459527 RepID=UPI00047640D6